MNDIERDNLLASEEEAYRLNESFLRSILQMKPLTEEDVQRHMAACKDFIRKGKHYAEMNSPFILGFKERRDKHE